MYAEIKPADLRKKIKNAELREELIRSKEQDELSKRALDLMILMAHKFSLKFDYVHEEDKEDCISFAIMDCYRYWRGYKPEKSSNAFAYVTQMVKNGMAKGWRNLYGRMPMSSKISIDNNNIYSL